jgi:hypothetical protein
MSRAKIFHHPILIGLALIVILALAYIFVYQTEPFPEPWPDIYLNLAIILPSILSAVLATLVWLSFQPQDGPRSVWKFFALGLWSWAVAETVWFGLWLIRGDVPTPSLADVFYVLALPLFAASFLLQYRLIFHPTPSQERTWLLAVLAGVLLLSVLGTFMLRSSSQGEDLSLGAAFLEVFYVAFDLAMLGAAIGLARLFGRGMWGRAWWGMLAFVLSDSLYSYVVNSGMYAQAIENGNLLSLVTDCSYAIAYMLMALACWSQLLLVWYGPSLAPQPSPEPELLAHENQSAPGSFLKR